VLFDCLQCYGKARSADRSGDKSGLPIPRWSTAFLLRHLIYFSMLCRKVIFSNEFDSICKSFNCLPTHIFSENFHSPNLVWMTSPPSLLKRRDTSWNSCTIKRRQYSQGFISLESIGLLLKIHPFHRACQLNLEQSTRLILLLSKNEAFWNLRCFQFHSFEEW